MPLKKKKENRSEEKNFRISSISFNNSINKAFISEFIAL